MTSSRSDDEVSRTGRDELTDLLIDTAYYVKLLGEAKLADTPLSLLSNRILTSVLADPGITVAELARRIPKTQQMVSHVVGQLAKLGLIERRLGPTRGVALHVTKAGRQAAEDGLARERNWQAAVCELIGEERSTALTELLRETRSILRDAR